jgi:cytochrome c553
MVAKTPASYTDAWSRSSLARVVNLSEVRGRFDARSQTGHFAILQHQPPARTKTSPSPGVLPMSGRTSRKRERLFAAAAGFVFLIAAGLPTLAAPSAEQKSQIAATGRDLADAEKLVKAGKAKEAAPLITKVQQALTSLFASGDRDVIRAIDPMKPRVDDLRTSLSLEGIDLPPFVVEKPKITKPTKPGKPAPGSVSFTKQIAPMLVAKCGKCHVDDSKGKFSMATFASLAKGAEAGRVIFPKDGKSSRIVEVIQSGDMPRGGGKVSADQLAALTKWIDEGANFDGGNINASLKALADAGAVAASKMEAPKLEVVQAVGNEKSSYSRDVAGVLSGCINCHGMQNPRGQFSVTAFDALLKGGMSGNVIVPGKPAESLLVKKLKGQAGDRMPLRAPALSSDVIAKIETWIAEGARFDGPAANTPTELVNELYISRHASHEDLVKKRVEKANDNWRVTLPGAENKPNTVSTNNFLVYGTVDEKELQTIADAAEKQIGRVSKTLKAPANEPFVKGKITIYVFDKRYDYSEFGQMVEKRQLPNIWQGHWGYTVTDAYFVLLLPVGEEKTAAALDSLIAQQLASVYVAAQGVGTPRWFAEGSGRAVASSLDARDKRIRAWDNSVGAVMASAPRGDAFMTGAMGPEESDLAAYAFVKEMRPGAGMYQKLLDRLRAGATFDRAFAAVYRATPSQMATAWGGKYKRR